MTITLPTDSPRTWQHVIEVALTRGGYIAVAEALHSARPRDLAEVLVLLPADVNIAWEEANDATNKHA